MCAARCAFFLPAHGRQGGRRGQAGRPVVGCSPSRHASAQATATERQQLAAQRYSCNVPVLYRRWPHPTHARIPSIQTGTRSLSLSLRLSLAPSLSGSRSHAYLDASPHLHHLVSSILACLPFPVSHRQHPGSFWDKILACITAACRFCVEGPCSPVLFPPFHHIDHRRINPSTFGDTCLPSSSVPALVLRQLRLVPLERSASVLRGQHRIHHIQPLDPSNRSSEQFSSVTPCTDHSFSLVSPGVANFLLDQAFQDSVFLYGFFIHRRTGLTDRPLLDAGRPSLSVVSHLISSISATCLSPQTSSLPSPNDHWSTPALLARPKPSSPSASPRYQLRHQCRSPVANCPSCTSLRGDPSSSTRITSKAPKSCPPALRH